MSNILHELSNPPIFVCGVQRAGTTLLVKMLDRNKQISFLPQETHLFPLLWNWSGKIKGISTNQELAEFLQEIWPQVNYGWTSEKAFLKEVCDAICEEVNFLNSAEEVLRFILRLWEVKQSRNVITGEKTPAHIYYAQTKFKQFPKCKMILMCRDPRAAALSEMIKLQDNPRVNRDFNTFNFVVRWATAVDIANRLSKRKDVLFLRYEDLILTPDSTLKNATNFLGVDFEPSMLEVGVTNSSFQDAKQKGIQFNEENLSRWKTDLPQEIVGQIEHHLKGFMKQLDYPLTNVKWSVRSKIKTLKQSLKLRAALIICKFVPAYFHHYNRNKKYQR